MKTNNPKPSIYGKLFNISFYGKKLKLQKPEKLEKLASFF